MPGRTEGRCTVLRPHLCSHRIATGRIKNGFERGADGEDNLSRSLPPTPEEYAADLRAELNTLKDAISMPRQKVSNLINAIEQGKVSDEEIAVLKRLVEKRGREATQATVTQVDTVQYCSLSPPTLEPSSDVCINLENNEGRMDPERGELEPPSAGTGPETPGQQCPPNEGTWKKGRTMADGYSLVDMGSNEGGDISSPTTERVDTRAVRTTADITFLQQGHKPKDKDKGSEENKQFDPGGKGEKAPLWNAAVTLSFFFWGERWTMGGLLLVLRGFGLCVSFCSVL